MGTPTRLARSYRDTRLGIEERFLQPVLAGSRTVGVLSTPLEGTPAMGWVLCHSFGMEQITLQPFEVAAARRLAGAGTPALRYHGPGYGDSEASQPEVADDAQVRAIVDAIGVLVEGTGVTSVGLIGARYGGTLAALAADRSGASALAMWNPVVNGRRYMADLLRAEAAAELVFSVEARETVRTPGRALEEEGLVGIQGGGFPLKRTTCDTIRSVDLPAQLSAFQGDALIVQLTRGTEVRRETRDLADRLGALGARCTVEVVADHAAPLFGFGRYRLTGRGTKQDTQAALAEALVSRTVAWATGLGEAAGG